MGVTGLWSIVQPCARPIKLETLNRKRLAVDASIWIYQFLKAVRDKEGNALRNSHVVGFFRRICKLLFFGIKPVFVFDGGAPALKRQTISGRKKRREGRREDAVRTAGKLLAVQMQRRAEENDRRRREEAEQMRNQIAEEEEEVPDNLVYVDELQMTAQERIQNRQFKKKDAYHLPNLDVSLTEMGAPNDPRIMSHEELEEYARQFHTGEDVNVYDFSKIDFNGPFFQSLPPSDRYNILNAARLRSRLRMGYSKDQLDTMFPDRMAFSRFQVERVKERNELTQRLMNINGMNGEDAMFGVNGGGRVAGEKGKEYVLVKNDGVEGGWALGVVSNKSGGERDKPIDVDGFGTQPVQEEASEDDGFEDVPIEGLNRLPKRTPGNSILEYNDEYDPDEMVRRRRTLYESRLEAKNPMKNATKPDDNKTNETEGGDSLFLPEEIDENELDMADEDNTLFEDAPALADEDEDLDRAIAMSLEQPGDEEKESETAIGNSKGYGTRVSLDFNERNAKIGRDFAHLTNARAHGVALRPSRDEVVDDSEVTEAQVFSKESLHGGPQVYRPKKTERLSLPPPPIPKAGISHDAAQPSPTHDNGFGGPLPFESLDLGKFVLGKKRKQKSDDGGGFEKEQPELREKPRPLPPWFTNDIRESNAAQQALEEKEDRGESMFNGSRPQTDHEPLRRQLSREVIDLDAPKSSGEVIEVHSSEDEGSDIIMADARPIGLDAKSGDIVDMTRENHPIGLTSSSTGELSKESGQERPHENISPTEGGFGAVDVPSGDSNSDEPIEWEESEHGDQAKLGSLNSLEVTTGGSLENASSAVRSTSPLSEPVRLTEMPIRFEDLAASTLDSIPTLPAEESVDMVPAEAEDGYSDPEDEELMRQLAVEAEEHARFASSLNFKSQAENAEEYEKELRQLRNQQKKDRRDADEVTHVMVTECQQLLKLFGLPYITAPMEAEAQCAELVSLGLVDGIVTDDSDIFLFGGTRVYKNMFNQAKFVECYLTADLEKEYSLDRERLIRVAHLLGSDYTDGLPTVGPVTALEILSEFETLEAFAEWCSSVQLGQKLSVEDSANTFRRKFRKTASKIFLPNPFPDKRVDYAYLNPEVDNDPSSFEWGVPDLDSLRSFLMATIGWTPERTDEVLVPVIRDINRRETEGTQANITQFFGGGTGIGAKQSTNSSSNSAFAPRRRAEGKSKRMESALGKLHEKARQRTIGEDANDEPAESQQGMVDEDTSQIDVDSRQPKQQRSRKRVPSGDPPIQDSDDDDGAYEAPKRSKKTRKSNTKRNGSRKGSEK